MPNLQQRRTARRSQCCGIVQNELLATLSPSAFARLSAHLSLVEAKRHSILHEAGKEIESVFFIEEGGVSRLVSTKADPPVEAALVGRFGLIGISAIIGSSIPSNRSVVSIPGSVLRITTRELRAAMTDEPEIREHLLRFAYLLLGQQAQTILCCVKHGLVQRLARWLLLTQDWVSGNPVPVTHDTLAMTLGSWRPTITDALAVLEKSGVVTLSRGAIHISDPSALAAQACECYKLLNEMLVSFCHTDVPRFDHKMPCANGR